MKILVIQAGDTRIDIIAQRVYGNPEMYKLIMRANPSLDIWNLIAGTIIEIPNV